VDAQQGEQRVRSGTLLTLFEQMMISVFVGASSSAVGEDEDEDEDQDHSVGYAYVGSHNFTSSAWGTPVLNVSVSVMPLASAQR
jgi:hypothetical protein